MKRKQRKWRVTRKQRVTECKMEGWRPRGGEEGQTRRGGARTGFLFFLWFGLHANTPERIVELRELKKKCIIQVRGMEEGGGGGGEGMKREHTHTKKRRGQRLRH